MLSVIRAKWRINALDDAWELPMRFNAGADNEVRVTLRISHDPDEGWRIEMPLVEGRSRGEWIKIGRYHSYSWFGEGWLRQTAEELMPLALPLFEQRLRDMVPRVEREIAEIRTFSVVEFYHLGEALRTLSEEAALLREVQDQLHSVEVG
jgi:hypothetical protein